MKPLIGFFRKCICCSVFRSISRYEGEVKHVKMEEGPGGYWLDEGTPPYGSVVVRWTELIGDKTRIYLNANATQKSLSQSMGNNEVCNFYNCNSVQKTSVSAEFEENVF